MDISNNSNNILSVLNNFVLDNPDDIAMQVAENFRKHRVEKNITWQRIAELSGVPLSTVARFEQKGLIAFESLVKLAMTLGYTSEIKNLFCTPKFDTKEELNLIRQKSNDKRAYVKVRKDEKTEKLEFRFRGRPIGLLSLTPDNPLNVFEYDKSWIADEFNISPLELPLKPSVFVAKPQPFYGNFGVFEDSLPDGYGRYLRHKALLWNGINDSDLSSLDRLALVGDNGMGALTYSPSVNLEHEEIITDFDRLQEIGLEVLKEQQDKNTLF